MNANLCHFGGCLIGGAALGGAFFGYVGAIIGGIAGLIVAALVVFGGKTLDDQTP